MYSAILFKCRTCGEQWPVAHISNGVCIECRRRGEWFIEGGQ